MANEKRLEALQIDYEFGEQESLFDLSEYEQDDRESGIGPDEARMRSEAARKALGQLTDLPGWYEEYLHLVDGKWPWRVAAYIAWAASPRTGRWPDTQEKLATDVLGLTSDRQIVKWRKSNRAIMDMVTALQVAPMLKHRADVVKALIASASEPDYKNHQDRKLFLEITGDYVPTAKFIAEQTKSADGLADTPTSLLEKQAGWNPSTALRSAQDNTQDEVEDGSQPG